MAFYQFGQGLQASYDALASKDQYFVYYCTDTHRMYVGAAEYTKGTKVLNATPTAATVGDADRLYAYNGNLYLCTGYNSTTSEYGWVRVANVNDEGGTITVIGVGEGLDTASGSTSITSTDTIKHAIPSGASTYTDSLNDQTPAFGSTFTVIGVSTDKFGHVIGVNDHTVTLPAQTAIGIAPGSTAAETLTPSGSFTVVTGVAPSTAVGATDHDLVINTETFTLPESATYTVSSTTEGVITLTGSNASASTALINGWDNLAKKSDITSVFKYKGSVATVADLQTVVDPQVGDVYQVASSSAGSNCEFVCTDATSSPTVWEELGTTVDLSAYATTAYVDERLTWRTF